MTEMPPMLCPGAWEIGREGFPRRWRFAAKEQPRSPEPLSAYDPFAWEIHSRVGRPASLPLRRLGGWDWD